MPIPPPPVPQRLREMLKDYPDLIERLQADLTYVANAKRRGTPLFERAIWMLEGVNERFADSLDRKGHGRYVPAEARDASYAKLPRSLDTIHADTGVRVRLFDREGAELYDSRTDPRPPGKRWSRRAKCARRRRA